MSNEYKDVLKVINDASKEGLISSEDKVTVKEMMLDNNAIVIEILDDFKENKDKADLIKRLKEYIQLCEEPDDDETEINRRALQQLGSPDGDRLVNIKKKKLQDKKEEDEFTNIEECEEGLSPKVVFNKK